MMYAQSMSLAVPKILVVGDGQSGAKDLERSLADLGYLVAAVARTGSDAVRFAEVLSPNLAFVDVTLEAAMDGVAIGEEIRRQEIPVIYTGTPLEDETLRGARVTGTFGFLLKPVRIPELRSMVELTLLQRRFAHEALENRASFEAILTNIRDGVISTDPAGQVTALNLAAEQLTGWPLSEAVGKPIEEIYRLLDPMRKQVENCPLRLALATGIKQRKARLLLLCRDGRELPIEDNTLPILDARGRIIGGLTLLCDVTEKMHIEQLRKEERKRLEEQVAQATEALGATQTELRALANRFITAQEEERRRLARELHDDLGQRIAFLQFEAERLQQHARVAEIQTGLQQISEEAAKFSVSLRELSHRLHPSVLEDLGLAAALRSLVDDYRRQGLDVTLSTVELAGTLPLDVRTSLYRITQEALRNTWKHAPNSAAHVKLREDGEQLQLTIEDTGPGFDVLRVRAEGGLGLLSMDERARLVGGTFLVSSKPEAGTILVVSIPGDARYR